MIQSISFSGNVIVGGSTYSALKASAGNIQGLPTEKLREQVSANFDKLKQHIAEITPEDARLALIFKKTDNIKSNGNKIKLLIEDLNNGNCIPIAAKRIRSNGRPYGVSNLFLKAQSKVDALFSNNTVEQKTLGQNIDKLA